MNFKTTFFIFSIFEIYVDVSASQIADSKANADKLNVWKGLYIKYTVVGLNLNGLRKYTALENSKYTVFWKRIHYKIRFSGI